jgi:hypothetical protein
MYCPGRSSYFPALCPPRSLRRDILSTETTSKLRAPLAEHSLPHREWEQRVPELNTPQIKRTVFVLQEW